MTNYVLNGNRIDIYHNSEVVIFPNLKNEFYNINVDIRENVYLEIIEKPVIKEKLYGDVIDKADRVIYTFKNTNKNLGCLFIGQKGSGKSLTSNYIALKSDLPVIVLDKTLDLDLVLDTIEKIQEDFVFMIDEMDKKYPRSSDDKDISRLLSLMSGSNKNNKILFLITANDIYRMSNLLINRPGRIRYKYDHNSIDLKECEEIIKDKIKDKNRIKEILDVLNLMDNITYDSLITLVEESILYPDIKVNELIKCLNVKNVDNETVNLFRLTYKENNLRLPVYGFRFKVVSNHYSNFNNGSLEDIYENIRNGVTITSDAYIDILVNDKDFKVNFNNKKLTVSNDKYILEIINSETKNVPIYLRQEFDVIKPLSARSKNQMEDQKTETSDEKNFIIPIE